MKTEESRERIWMEIELEIERLKQELLYIISMHTPIGPPSPPIPLFHQPNDEKSSKNNMWMCWIVKNSSDQL